MLPSPTSPDCSSLDDEAASDPESESEAAVSAAEPSPSKRKASSGSVPLAAKKPKIDGRKADLPPGTLQALLEECMDSQEQPNVSTFCTVHSCLLLRARLQEAETLASDETWLRVHGPWC